MASEIIDTNSNFSGKELPDGENTFRILSCRKNGTLNILRLSYSDGEGEIVMFGNQMGDIFRLCGFKEVEKGKFEVDRMLMEGVQFKAEVYQEADKKTGKMYKRMRNYQPADGANDVPF